MVAHKYKTLPPLRRPRQEYYVKFKARPEYRLQSCLCLFISETEYHISQAGLNPATQPWMTFNC